ncbi:MAG TPA: hypothetical protein VF720_13570, partial [Candidatus Eisenbacteria bacterium]
LRATTTGEIYVMKRITTMSCLAAAVLATALAGTPVGATPPNPSPGTAVVDGNPGEWNLATDFFTNMYRAGNPSKPIESKAYLRYDCSTHTMYVLVLGVPGVPVYIDSNAVTAWVAIDNQSNKVVNEASGNDGIPPDFEWIGRNFDSNNQHALGYEASFPLAEGSCNIIVHCDVDNGGAQTSASPGFPGTGPPLVVACDPVPTVTSTWSGVKKLLLP